MKTTIIKTTHKICLSITLIGVGINIIDMILEFHYLSIMYDLILLPFVFIAVISHYFITIENTEITPSNTKIKKVMKRKTLRKISKTCMIFLIISIFVGIFFFVENGLQWNYINIFIVPPILGWIIANILLSIRTLESYLYQE